MRNRISRVLCALVIALAIPAATMAADTPVAVYQGTWDTAGWTADPEHPEACPFPPEVEASGNWNVTILPGDTQAVVHITMFTFRDGYRIHVNSWGGNAFGLLWTVESANPNSFVLKMDLSETAPFFSTNTFVLDDGTLTFTIEPWFTCLSATAYGTQR